MRRLLYTWNPTRICCTLKLPLCTMATPNLFRHTTSISTVAMLFTPLLPWQDGKTINWALSCTMMVWKRETFLVGRDSSFGTIWRKCFERARERDKIGQGTLSTNAYPNSCGLYWYLFRNDLAFNINCCLFICHRTRQAGPDEQGISPVFEGSFEIRNDVYHIKTTDMYYRTKRSDDVTLPDDNYLETPSMVVYRDSDTSMVAQQQQPQDHLLHSRSITSSSAKSTSNQTQGCGTDRLTINSHQQSPNPFILRAGHPASGLDGLYFPPSSFSVLGSDHRLSTLSKRATTGCPTSRKSKYAGSLFTSQVHH